MIWGVRITAARGNLVAVCGFYSFFEERNKEGSCVLSVASEQSSSDVLSFGANERTKENIHPSQALPYMEEM